MKARNFCIALLLLATSARAEVVVLRTGEKIRGRIVSRDANRLEVETSSGRVEVEASRVASVEEREPLEVEFRAQLTQLPDTDADGFFRVGVWCGEKGLFDLRESVLWWVIGLDPDHDRARSELGFYRSRNGQWVKGTPAEENQEVSELFRRALNHYGRREDEKAIEILMKILESSPRFTDASFLLGDIHYATGKMGHARTQFENILKSDPASPLGPYGMALISLDGNKLIEAESYARQALKLVKDEKPPNYRKALEAEFQYVLGMAFRLRGASGRAEGEKAFRESVGLDRRHYRAWTELGILQGEKGKFREAYDAFGKALAVESDHAPARYNWGVALYRSGNLKEAVQKLLPLSRTPVHVESLKILGRCFHRFNDLTRARMYYEQYVEKGGKDERVAQWLREIKN